MLEPQLPANRVAFERYSRLMLHTVWVLPVAMLVASIVVIGGVKMLGLDGAWINRVMIPLAFGALISAGLFMGYCELQKTLIFRRDLRERRNQNG